MRRARTQLGIAVSANKALHVAAPSAPSVHRPSRRSGRCEVTEWVLGSSPRMTKPGIPQQEQRPPDDQSGPSEERGGAYAPRPRRAGLQGRCARERKQNCSTNKLTRIRTGKYRWMDDTKKCGAKIGANIITSQFARPVRPWRFGGRRWYPCGFAIHRPGTFRARCRNHRQIRL